MAPLATNLRRDLERAIIDARKTAERGARSALSALTVPEAKAGPHLDAAGRELRNRLRAHARQLGDKRSAKGNQAIDRLVRECAYEHWHRMLFARFLAENDLLIEPESGVSVSLDDVEELAREQKIDQWELASRYAQRMLPQIFRPDDPVLAVALPTETRLELESLLESLPPEAFTADDSLGWVYQFWQSAEKDAVNDRVKSGEKITGETLPAVTQLFTEHYMVLFLLHNTIGAWHAGKVLTDAQRESAASEQELRDAVRLAALDGYDFDYLRFVREPKEGEDLNEGTGPWRPAAGTYDGWPKTAAELRVLDPCCGSGHFLVAAFDLLVRLRIAEEGLSTEDAIGAVIADNLFGLELDARCTQIAAFNLALAAWKLAGKPIELPPMHIACSGLGPQSTVEEWLRMAEPELARERPDVREAMRRGLTHMHELFSDAPDLGSLIDPNELPREGFAADFETLKPLLDRILAAESADEDAHERAVAAHGMAAAAEILAGDYSLVITNVPYLGRGSQSDRIKAFAETNYKEAKADLATVFVARMLRWVGHGRNDTTTGSIAAVTPQNWLFLTSYKKLRETLLKQRAWEMVVRLGEHAFESSAAAGAFAALVLISGNRPGGSHIMAGVDVSANRGQPPIYASAKAALLRGESPEPADDAEPAEPAASDDAHASDAQASRPDGSVRLVPQKEQVKNPDARILLRDIGRGELLGAIATYNKGICTGDDAHYRRYFWEVARSDERWGFLQSSVDATTTFGGYDSILLWEGGEGDMDNYIRTRLGGSTGAWIRGDGAWGKCGVLVRCMGHNPVALYEGAFFDSNTVAIIPEATRNLLPMWAFMASDGYSSTVRSLNQKLNVGDDTFVKVPFDLDHWQKVAAEKYPHGLPEPQSNDPTQWLFHGHPAGMLAAGPADRSPIGLADPVGADRHPSLICREPNLADVLQVGVARLLGYRWPAELDEDMRLDEAQRAWVERCADLADHADEDGIVCLSPLRGEAGAADRLRALLRAAMGEKWSVSLERRLLDAAAEKHKQKTAASDLQTWLRDCFFEEHCKTFHHRPFIWHIWDGRRDGFHGLVNYHKLAAGDGRGRKTLESLTYSYLGDWITRQQDAVKSGEPGAEARLAAAMELKEQLEKILAGEPPYDLFIRWKPLHEQPIGWEPDINDGVRLNIRPFMNAALSKGRKGAGVLRWKPNIKWTKDRGKEPQSIRPREDFPWFWSWDEKTQDFAGGAEFDGNRWNDLHYTNAFKQAARERASEETKA